MLIKLLLGSPAVLWSGGAHLLSVLSCVSPPLIFAKYLGQLFYMQRRTCFHKKKGAMVLTESTPGGWLLKTFPHKHRKTLACSLLKHTREHYAHRDAHAHKEAQAHVNIEAHKHKCNTCVYHMFAEWTIMWPCSITIVNYTFSKLYSNSTFQCSRSKSEEYSVL